MTCLILECLQTAFRKPISTIHDGCYGLEEVGHVINVRKTS
jgi:hypothetical protein